MKNDNTDSGLSRELTSLSDEILYLANRDFVYVENPDFGFFLGAPYRMDSTAAFVCTGGKATLQMDLTEVEVKASSILIMQNGSIVYCDRIEPTLEGFIIVMSERFLDRMIMGETAASLPLLSVQLKENPCISFDEATQESILTYGKMMKTMLCHQYNPYIEEAMLNLTRAFFYGMGYFIHTSAFLSTHAPYSPYATKLLALVKENFREHRDTGFYADKMCLTPKYLSKVIKAETGRTVSDWVEEYTVLEAKVMLRRTNMTVSQIADELNFPSQSFFGKYFKRLTGLSPKEYRQ